MQFPQALMNSARWMVRRTGQKHCRSAHETKPTDYETPPGKIDTPLSWTMRWNVPAVWSTFNAAKSYVERRPQTYEGLTFVTHHDYCLGPQDRTVVFDLDKCFNEAGELDPVAVELIDLLPETFW